MPKIPIFRLGGSAGKTGAAERWLRRRRSLRSRASAVGVDNLRHDVVLSPKFVELARAQIARSIARHGELEGLLAAEASQPSQVLRGCGTRRGRLPRPKHDPGEWKSALTDLQIALAQPREKRIQALGRSSGAPGSHEISAHGNESAVCCRCVERCRVLLKSYDTCAQQKAHEYRETLAVLSGAEEDYSPQDWPGNF